MNKAMVFMLGFLILQLSGFSAGADSTTFPDGAGSNMVFYSIGKYATAPTDANWQSDVKVTLLHYQEYQADIRARLKTMRANGQTKISLMLWYVEEGLKCQYFSHVICPQSGKIPTQIESNIKNIMADIAKAGYDTVVFRLAAQGKADPLQDGYESARAMDSWKLFESVYTLVEGSIAGTKLKVLYDLGVETMGHPFSLKPGAQAFLNTMWTHYAQKYPLNKTVGFSFNHAHDPATKESFRVYQNSGAWPGAVAIDIYEDPDKFLKIFAQGLAAFGKSSEPVIMTETYRNSLEFGHAFAKDKKAYNLNFRFLTQWPLNQGASHNVDNPLTPDIFNYWTAPVDLSVIPAVNPVAPIIVAAGAGCADLNCLYVVAQNIEKDSYVDIRFMNSNTPISYRGTDLVVTAKADGNHVITLRLKTVQERNELRAHGLRVWVVNPQGHVWNTNEYVIKPIGGALTTVTSTSTSTTLTRPRLKLRARDFLRHAGARQF